MFGGGSTVRNRNHGQGQCSNKNCDHSHGSSSHSIENVESENAPFLPAQKCISFAPPNPKEQPEELHSQHPTSHVDYSPTRLDSEDLTAKEKCSLNLIMYGAQYPDDLWIREVRRSDVNYSDEKGNTLLHKACDKGYKCVMECLELGADVNVQSESNETPLSWAIINGDIRCVKALIDHGADLTIKIKGINFLHVAAKSNNQALLFFLLRYRPELKRMLVDRSNSGYTCLHYAAQEDQYITVQTLLLTFGMDFNLADHRGNTAMHVACKYGCRKTVKMLLKCGAQWTLTKKNKDDQVPTILIKSKELQKYILQFKRRVNNPIWKRIDKWTNNKYRFGLFKAFPQILTFYVVCQITAYSHMLHYMSHYHTPVLQVFLLLIGNVAACIYISLVRSDPGIIPKRNFSDITQQFDDLLFQNKTKQLCITCGIVRPWRSKHSSDANVCVRRFDHACPWIGNVVGAYNMWRFLAFIILQPVAQAVYIYMYWTWINSDDPYVTWSGYFIGLTVALFGFALVVYGIFMTMTFVHFYGRNLTTNDMINAYSYPWFTSPGKIDSNLFDFGWKNNISLLLAGDFSRHKGMPSMV